MSGKIISIANSKGGVGKTTTCVSLAEAFAAEGRRTLVVDLDMQANASMIIFGRGGDERLYDAISGHKTVTDYLDENFFGEQLMKLSEFITHRASDVTHTGRTLDISLVASSPGLRRTERALIYELTSQGYSMHAIEGRVGQRLTSDLEHLKSQFDIILCDCPPGISAMTETVLAISDVLIVPTIPDFMSTLGLDLFIGDVVPQLNRDSGEGLPYVLATRFTASDHQRIVLNAMCEGAEGGETEYSMLSTIIPATPDFAVNPIELGHAPTLAQKWPGEALGVLDSLHKEIAELLK
ncbi:MAG: AAA family ATPase [Pseudomonadota bacterium]